MDYWARKYGSRAFFGGPSRWPWWWVAGQADGETVFGVSSGSVQDRLQIYNSVLSTPIRTPPPEATDGRCTGKTAPGTSDPQCTWKEPFLISIVETPDGDMGDGGKARLIENRTKLFADGQMTVKISPRARRRAIPLDETPSRLASLGRKTDLSTPCFHLPALSGGREALVLNNSIHPQNPQK